MTKNQLRKSIILLMVLCFSISMLIALLHNVNIKTVNAKEDVLATRIAQIEGKSYGFDSTLSPNEFAYIYTDSMESLSNKYVVISYKIDYVLNAASGRIGVAWGQSYENNNMYESSRKGALFYEDYPTNNLKDNIFFKESLEGKYITFVIWRQNLRCPVYVSSEAPTFDSDMIVTNGEDAGSFAYQMVGYSNSGQLLNIYQYHGNEDILLDNKIVGALIGEGSGKISELKVYDENGNDLGVNVTGDFSIPSSINYRQIEGKSYGIDTGLNMNEFAYLYTKSMESLSNEKVIFSYKVDIANETEGRIGVAWGQNYENNNLFDSSRKGCLFFENYPSTNLQNNIFFNKELEGKYITVIISRTDLSCPVYVSDTAPIFNDEIVVTNGIDGGSFAYQMVGYSSSGTELNIYDYDSNKDILTDSKIVGLMIGEGTGKISEIRIFDENGNDLGVNVTGDFCDPSSSIVDYSNYVGTYYDSETNDYISLNINRTGVICTNGVLKDIRYNIEAYRSEKEQIVIKDGKIEFNTTWLYRLNVLVDTMLNSYSITGFNIISENARYKKLSYCIVNFYINGNDDKAFKTIEITNNNYKIIEPEQPTKNGYKFNGWCLADGTKFDFDNIVTESTSLYAKWEREEVVNGSCSSSIESTMSITYLALFAFGIVVVFIKKAGKRENGKDSNK